MIMLNPDHYDQCSRSTNTLGWAWVGSISARPPFSEPASSGSRAKKIKYVQSVSSNKIGFTEKEAILNFVFEL